MPSAARSRRSMLLRAAFVLLVPTVIVPAAADHWPQAAALPSVSLTTRMAPPAAPPAPAVVAPAAPLALTVPAAPVDGAITVEPLPSSERLVNLANVNTGERATFRIGPRGYVRSEEVAAVDHFFRCRRTERERAIAPEVLVLLADISARWPGRVIEIISGFRAPPFGAPHSRHFAGRAIDLRVRGVKTSAVRDFVWREHQGVGVGHYSDEDFVHVDARSEEDEIAWSAREEAATPEYNPRWAKRARRGLGSVKASAFAPARGGARTRAAAPAPFAKG